MFRFLLPAATFFKTEKNILKLILTLVITWVVGTLLVSGFEGLSPKGNEAFHSISNTFWNIAVYLFSGLDSEFPNTALGKTAAISILVISTVTIAMLTGALASMFFEYRSRGRLNMPKSYKPDDHVIICNWNNKVIPLIKQIHAEELLEQRAVIIISDNPNAGQFEENEISNPESYGGEFDTVYLIKGDPSQDRILRRANPAAAHSIIVLADDQEPNPDGKSIFVCMAIREIVNGHNFKGKCYIIVETMRSENVSHFERAGADDVICTEEYGMLLLSQTSYQHGIAQVYKDLMTFSDEGRDSNELYKVDVPESDIGLTFKELGAKIYEHRINTDPIILIGAVSTNGEYILNPNCEEQVFEKGNKALVLAWSKPERLYDPKA